MPDLFDQGPRPFREPEPIWDRAGCIACIFLSVLLAVAVIVLLSYLS